MTTYGLPVNPPPAPPGAGSPPDARATDGSHLSGRWLLLGRVSWVTLVTCTMVIVLGSLPVYLAELQILCAGKACIFQQLTAAQLETLHRLGWSLGDYAALQVALSLIATAVSLGISTLIVWRRSNDRMALLVALMLVTGGAMVETTAVASISSPWQVPNRGLSFVSLSLLLFVLLIFPSGRFVPRWTRWIFVVFLAASAAQFLFPLAILIPGTAVSDPGWLIALGQLTTVALVQVYRYRRVSSPMQRQQTKWVVFGYALPIAVAVIGTALALIPALAESGSPYPIVLNDTGFLLTIFPALSFGVAILRYRLWNIDAIIHNALVYGMLTGILGALYFGLILGLESFIGLLTRQAFQPVVIVISTLAIYGLFQPLRGRIQNTIDRRFYRRKYDAEKTIAAFAATLRTETDLSHLSEQLTTVVQETMQPEHIALWLRPPQPQ